MFDFRKRRMKNFERKTPEVGQLDIKKYYFERLLSDLKFEFYLYDNEYFALCETLAKQLQFNLFEGVNIDNFLHYIKDISVISQDKKEAISQIRVHIERADKQKKFPFNIPELSKEYVDYKVKIFNCNGPVPLSENILKVAFYEWVDPKERRSLDDEELETFEY